MITPEAGIDAPKSYLELLENQICDLATSYDPHTTNTMQHIEQLLGWIHSVLKRQLMSASFAGEDRHIALDRYQTFVLDMGRQGGNLITAQMLANEKTLVFDAPSTGNVLLARPQGIPSIDEAVYGPLKQAKVIQGDAAAFLHELNTDKYEAVVIYGTRSLTVNIGEASTAEFTTQHFREQLYYLGKRDSLKHVLIIG
jgi:hypothetical protein